MTTPEPELFLITGIPGTGKTCYGDKFATDFGFVHYDLEDPQTLGRFTTFAQLIIELLSLNKSVIVTWGFNPEDPPSLELIRQLRNAGFKMIWFDGNREATLRAFRERVKSKSSSDAEFYLRMHEFYLQMYRIEHSGILARLGPISINPFDPKGQFKSPDTLLEEIRRS